MVKLSMVYDMNGDDQLNQEMSKILTILVRPPFFSYAIGVLFLRALQPGQTSIV